MPVKTKKQKQHSTLPLAVALSHDVQQESLDETIDSHTFSEDGLHVSEEVYWADYYEHPDFKYEWNNGILEEKGMSNIDTGLLYDWFADLLAEYLRHYPIARKLGIEIGGRIKLTDKVLVRRPDLWIVLNSNPISLEGKDNAYYGTFDICIEAISKTKEKYKTKDTIDKKKEYALGGVKEYYILDGDEEETIFYRLNEHGVYEEIESQEDVIKSEVLPGFQFRLSDLYKRPPIKDLRYDEVYKHFVALDLQAEVEARQQAEEQAKEAKQKAEAEAKARQAAEAEVERLKALLQTLKNTEDE